MATQIATLNAILRLDSAEFKKGVRDTKGQLADLSKGLQKGAADAKQFGQALASRFLSAAAIIGLTIKLVNGLRQEWKQLTAMQVEGTLPLDTIVKNMKELEKVESRRRWTAAAIDFLTGRSSVKEMRAEVEHNANLIRGSERLIEQRRALRDVEAQIRDVLSGTKDATRALELERHGGQAELVEAKHRLEDLTRLRSQVDAMLAAGKTATERMAESQEVLNAALREGIIEVREYEEALKRLRMAGGRAVAINPLTAVRERAPQRQASTPSAGEGRAVVAEIRALRVDLRRDGFLETTRLR